ncbi:MAG: DinB family protein [Bacteroidetes bacterium]|nr:DinB family protein [Bacteroidota bacterium]
MTKLELLKNFTEKHVKLTEFISSLPDIQFAISRHGKWSPGQQLSHVNLCLKPILKALIAKGYLLQKFGKLTRATFDYDTVISKYTAALNNGGKAPDQFVPEEVTVSDKKELIAEMEMLLKSINDSTGHYTDEELDAMIMPHPLLGQLSISEMFHLMTYHAEHHLNQTVLNLKDDN